MNKLTGKTSLLEPMQQQKREALIITVRKTLTRMLGARQMLSYGNYKILSLEPNYNQLIAS
jgi:hypothetical protein